MVWSLASLLYIFFGERRRRSPILAQYLGENIANNKQSASRALSTSLGGEQTTGLLFF
jgi:hypothetical protein